MNAIDAYILASNLEEQLDSIEEAYCQCYAILIHHSTQYHFLLSLWFTHINSPNFIIQSKAFQLISQVLHPHTQSWNLLLVHVFRFINTRECQFVRLAIEYGIKPFLAYENSERSEQYSVEVGTLKKYVLQLTTINEFTNLRLCEVLTGSIEQRKEICLALIQELCNLLLILKNDQELLDSFKDFCVDPPYCLGIYGTYYTVTQLVKLIPTLKIHSYSFLKGFMYTLKPQKNCTHLSSKLPIWCIQRNYVISIDSIKISNFKSYLGIVLLFVIDQLTHLFYESYVFQLLECLCVCPNKLSSLGFVKNKAKLFRKLCSDSPSKPVTMSKKLFNCYETRTQRITDQKPQLYGTASHIAATHSQEEVINLIFDSLDQLKQTDISQLQPPCEERYNKQECPNPSKLIDLFLNLQEPLDAYQVLCGGHYNIKVFPMDIIKNNQTVLQSALLSSYLENLSPSTLMVSENLKCVAEAILNREEAYNIFKLEIFQKILYPVYTNTNLFESIRSIGISLQIENIWTSVQFTTGNDVARATLLTLNFLVHMYVRELCLNESDYLGVPKCGCITAHNFRKYVPPINKYEEMFEKTCVAIFELKTADCLDSNLNILEANAKYVVQLFTETPVVPHYGFYLLFYLIHSNCPTARKTAYAICYGLMKLPNVFGKLSILSLILIQCFQDQHHSEAVQCIQRKIYNQPDMLGRAFKDWDPKLIVTNSIDEFLSLLIWTLVKVIKHDVSEKMLENKRTGSDLSMFLIKMLNVESSDITLLYQKCLDIIIVCNTFSLEPLKLLLTVYSLLYDEPYYSSITEDYFSMALQLVSSTNNVYRLSEVCKENILSNCNQLYHVVLKFLISMAVDGNCITELATHISNHTQDFSFHLPYINMYSKEKCLQLFQSVLDDSVKLKQFLEAIFSTGTSASSFPLELLNFILYSEDFKKFMPILNVYLDILSNTQKSSTIIIECLIQCIESTAAKEPFPKLFGRLLLLTIIKLPIDEAIEHVIFKILSEKPDIMSIDLVTWKGLQTAVAQLWKLYERIDQSSTLHTRLFKKLLASPEVMFESIYQELCKIPTFQNEWTKICKAQQTDS